MRFPGFSSGPQGSVSLLGPLGKEYKVLVNVRDNGCLELATKRGQVLETLQLGEVSWVPCALPGPGAAHCLSLQVRSTAPRELVLKAKSRDRLAALQQKLDAAAAAEAAKAAKKREHEELLMAAAAEAGAVEVHRLDEEGGAAMGQRVRPTLGKTRAASPRQPVGGKASSTTAGGAAVAATGGSRTAGEGEEDADDIFSVSFGSVAHREDAEGRESENELVSEAEELLEEAGEGSGASSPDSSDSSSGSLSSTPKSRGHHTTKEAGHDAAAAAAAAGAAAAEDNDLTPPVRLLSVRGARGDPPGSGVVQTHVQRLEAMVAQLNAEVAAARIGSTPKGKAGGHPGGSMLAGSPSPDSSSLSPTRVQRSLALAGVEHHPAAAAVAADSSLAPPAAAHAQQHNAGNSSSSSSTPAAAALAREHAALLRQQELLQTELGRAQQQLAQVTAESIRLAQQASEAEAHRRAAAAEAAATVAREQQLRGSLAAAVEQCAAVAGELRELSSRLDSRNAACEELQRAVEGLSQENAVLAGALTAARLQLKEATPPGFAEQLAALQRRCEAAEAAAGTAASSQVAAEAQAAEARRREMQAAEEVKAIHAARLEAEARERQLSGEVAQLRRQLADTDAASAAAAAAAERSAAAAAAREEIVRQEAAAAAAAAANSKVAAAEARAEQLAAALEGAEGDRVLLLGQVDELQRTGQDLSSSCSSLERALAAAAAERERLAAALAAAQAGAAAAATGWERERERLQERLDAAEGQLHGSEDDASSSKTQAVLLRGQLEAAKEELAATRQRAAAKEAELQGELRLLTSRADAEARSLRERLDSATTAAAAEAARAADASREREAAAAAAEREMARLDAEVARLGEEMRRGREEAVAALRDKALEASSLREEVARLGDELAASRAAAEAAARRGVETAKGLEQSRTQLASSASREASLLTERKGLLGQVERLGVERDRAVRERDALDLRCTALQQQKRLLEAVALHSSGGGSGGACKENGDGSSQGFRIQAQHQHQHSPRQHRYGGKGGVLSSMSD